MILMHRTRMGEKYIWYHGVAYRDYLRDQDVTFCFPLNHFVGWWVRRRFRHAKQQKDLEAIIRQTREKAMLDIDREVERRLSSRLKTAFKEEFGSEL